MAVRVRLRLHDVAYDHPPFGTVIVALAGKEDLDNLIVGKAMGESQTDTTSANVHQFAHGAPPATQFRNEDLPPTGSPRVQPSFSFSDLPGHDDTLPKTEYKRRSVNYTSQR
jgi:hypothetical protein